MEMVKIDEAKEGMTIVADVINKQGNVLLKEGTTLTEDLIKGLKALKIPGVYIKDIEAGHNPDNISSTVSTEVEELTELKELEHKFSDVRDNEIMGEIMAAVQEYLKEKGSSNGTG